MSEWYSFNDQMNEIFGGKVYRLSLSAGCTCPNRDGTLAEGGCIFCSAGGSGEYASAYSGNILEEIEQAKRRVRQKIGKNTRFAGYMAYFQSFTSTYGDTARLVSLFQSAVSAEEVVALSVATRPDCLSDDMILALSGINNSKPVFVELGLQTIHGDTAQYINRCYSLDVFEDTFIRLKKAGLRVVVHVIAGLPGEHAGRTIETVRWLSQLKYARSTAGISETFGLFGGSGKGAGSNLATAHGHAREIAADSIDGIKLQLLYVLRGTRLAALFPDETVLYESPLGEMPGHYIRLSDGMCLPQYSLREYALLIRELIHLLPGGTAVHRVTGDPPRKDLILPLWASDKKKVLNTIRKEFRKDGSCRD